MTTYPRAALALALGLACAFGSAPAQNPAPASKQLGSPYPAVVLRCPELSLGISLPGSPDSFYQSTRFDHSGVIGPVILANGVRLFGPWKETHDPRNNDSIVGPVDEFDMDAPPGYSDAKVGEPFLKIGVGSLVKPQEEKYRFWHHYEIRSPGKWQTTTADKSVTFRQEHTLGDYGYDYTKVIELIPAEAGRGGAGFRIRHTLKNTGTKPIESVVYNHNFFNVNGDTTGPKTTIEFPHPVKPEKQAERFDELVKIEGGKLTLKETLSPGSIHTHLSGFPEGAAEYRFTYAHAPTNTKVRVVGTGAPLNKFCVWGVASCLCPEPFVNVKAAPRGAAEWQIEYRFE